MIYDYKMKKGMVYNREELLNQWFLVR